MAFCIPPKIADAFLKRIKSGEIDPLKLADLTSAERRSTFSEVFGEQNAQKVNALFESKILLKDQQRGFITWIKTVGNLKPEVRRDMLAKVERIESVLEPADVSVFMEDLVAQRLGMKVSFNEASKIAELAKDVAVKKENLSTPESRFEYGMSQVAFNKFVKELKLESGKRTLKEKLIQDPSQIVSDIAGTAKAAKASMDNSAIFRQGWKTLMTDTGIWHKRAIQTFSDIAKTLKGEEIIDTMNADFFSRKNTLNGKAKKAKLDIGTTEEAFPTSVLQKIPGLGRLYKASEVAYTAFVQKVRFDVFDKYIEIAERSGVDLTKVELESIGKLANSITGRGELGKLEPVSKLVNNVFFSPRLLKSNWDVLTAHQLQKGVTPFVRKQAAKNLLKIVSGSAAILALAEAVRPGSVEKDPRSADFGKVRVGDTRFDVTGGMGSLMTLISRQISNASKSSTTGIVSELGTGDFGSMDRTDVLYNFFENKLSPLASVAKELGKGQTFEGDKPTVMNQLENLFVPISVSTFEELNDNPNSANVALSMILEGLGISANTYGASSVNWNNSTGKELVQFKEKVGQDDFDKANKEFNEAFSEWFEKARQDERFLELTEDDKKKVVTSKKGKIKDSIFKSHQFKLKREKSTKLPKL